MVGWDISAFFHVHKLHQVPINHIMTEFLSTPDVSTSAAPAPGHIYDEDRHTLPLVLCKSLSREHGHCHTV